MSENTIGNDYNPLPKKEFLSYGVIGFGHSITITTVNMFIAWFYTDFVGLPAAFAGAIFLFGRIIDALTDPMMGAIVDRTKSKIGKCLPWFFRMGLPLGIATVLNFTVPDTSMAGKMAYCAVMYTLTYSFINTAVAVPLASLISRMTRNPGSLKSLSGLLPMVNMAGSLLGAIVQIPLITAFGFNMRAFIYVYSIYSGIGVICMLLGAKNVKERVVTIKMEKVEKVQEKRNLKKELGLLVTNKYWLLMVFSIVMFFTSQGLGANMIYLYAHVMGDANLNGIFGMANLLPMIIGIPIFITIAKRIRNRRLVIAVSTFIAALLFFLHSIDPVPVARNLIIVTIRSFALVPFITLMYAMLVETIEYGEWKHGVRTEGLAFSAVSFAQKIGQAATQAIGLFIMSIAGFDGTLAVQTPSALRGVTHAVTTMGAVTFFILFILVLVNNLDKKMPEVLENLKTRRAANL